MIADQIYYECTASNCLAGMEIFRDFNNKKKVHKVSFEAPVAKFSHIKKGNMIPGMKCYKCDQEKLIRV